MHNPATPILLFDGECAICRRLARWISESAKDSTGKPCIVVRPVGHDPEALRQMNPDLDIWKAYATNYLLMTDGSMKHGGEAVAEVLRILPNTRWFSWCFAIRIFGFQPFQLMLNLAYAILDDIRPIFGCESCGTPSAWVKPIAAIMAWISAVIGRKHSTAPRRKPPSRSSAVHRPPATHTITPRVQGSLGS